MAMTYDVARLRLAREIQSTERALDEALLRNSSLMTTMVDARMRTDAEAFEGQAALLRLSRSQTSLLEASNDLARVHGQLKTLQTRMAGFEDCPKNEPMGLSEAEKQTG